jgi:hypothetical protein
MADIQRHQHLAILQFCPRYFILVLDYRVMLLMGLLIAIYNVWTIFHVIAG